MSDVLRIENRIRCGIVLSGADRAAARSQAQRAESLGFDSLWVGDHIAFHVPIPDSLAMLAFAAGVTERITLGTSVYLLPLRHPTLIAKTTATVDLLSGGRLVLGVGVGGEYPPEFAAVGVPVAERGARAEEAIGVVRRLWTEDGVAHAGKHFQFGAVTVAPKPMQVPPIWVGGRAPAAIRRAGRLGDGYISHMCDAERYRDNMDLIEATAREAGRREVAFTPASFLFTFLEDRFEDAEKKAAGLLGRIYRRDFSDAAKRYCLLGRPEDCLEQLHAFARSGARHFILAPLSDPAAFAERAAAEILPQLRALTG
jgi:probable F420-dependent oxidoreductase